MLVRDVPDEAAAAMALIENIQREDLNPLEEAQGLSRLVKEFGLTHEQAAQAVGRSRSAATNLLRLLNLAEPVQTMLMAGDIDMGHARALLTLDRATQITAGNQIAAKKMSVREAESLVKKIGAEFSLTRQKAKKDGKSRDVKRIEEELSDLLTADVEVRIKKTVRRHGKVQELGEIAIQFGSLDELNGIIESCAAKADSSARKEHPRDALLHTAALSCGSRGRYGRACAAVQARRSGRPDRRSAPSWRGQRLAESVD